MDGTMIPTISGGEAQAPNGGNVTGSGTIHISLDKLGSIKPNDILTLEFIENLTKTNSNLIQSKGNQSEITSTEPYKTPIKVHLNTGQSIEVSAEDLHLDKSINIEKGTVIQAKVTFVGEKDITIRLQSIKAQAALPSETLENAGIKNTFSEYAIPQERADGVIKNEVFQGIKANIEPLRLSQPIEIIGKEAGLTPKLLQELKVALNEYEIKFDSPRINANEFTAESIKEGKEGINPKIFTTDLFNNIKELYRQNKPLHEVVKAIVNVFKALEGKALPAQTQDYPQGTLFKTAIGNIFPEKDIKLPQNIKLELPIKEVKEVIENKLDELFRADFWKFSTTGRTETKAAPEVLKNIFKLLKNENLSEKIPQPESKDFFTNIRGFIKAVKNSEVSQWLGREATQEILSLPRGQETINILQNFIDSSHREIGLWRIVEIPIISGETIEQIRLAVKRQAEEDEEEKEEKQKENLQKGGTRFVVESRFSYLGGFQFDGLAEEKKRRFDLIIRTEKLLDNDLCTQIMRLYKTTLHKFDYWGTIQINLKENFIKPWEDNIKADNKGQGILV